MAWIILTPNPFAPFEIEKHEVSSGTIADWVRKEHPDTLEFPTPTICLLNGQPLLRAGWGVEVRERDVVNFIAVAGELFTIIVAIIVVALAVVVLLMPLPVSPNMATTPASDPVFTVKGQANAIRLGEPIECSYGRNRIYPSYAARPYFEYISNDQFQHSLFCIGQGQYEIESIMIGDTVLGNYEEVTYQVIEPGGEITLFPTNVYTASEAGGQTLFAENQVEYTGNGWVGPFPANPSGSLTNKIQIDLIYPKGLYSMADNGSLSAITVRVRGQRRLLDQFGNPAGEWVELAEPWFEKTATTATPQRATFSVDVPPGRYEVMLKNDGSYIDSTRVGNDVVWDGLRSWINTEHQFGDVTLLAVKVRATNNLNERTQQQFSVVCTRKLPIRESTGVFTEPQATRSIVWAFVDIFRSLYGGRITDPLFLDWDTLDALDALYESRGEHFDWIFRDPSTVWEAAQTVARAGRAVPLIAGSLITMKRDGPLLVPVTLFNHENIIAGSFEWNIKLWDIDEFDSIRAEYTEVSTGYKQEVVVASLPGETADNPEDIRMVGVQDRTHAYRAALYLLACRRYLRENVTFETGLEGYIPTYGDLIAVSHDVPQWGQAGYVVNAVLEGTNFYRLWLSEPLVWGVGEHHILLRGKKSEVVGPLVVTATDDPMQVLVTTAGTTDFLLTGETEPMLFVFGVVGAVTKLMKVVRIEPQGGEKVRVTAVNDSAIPHSFDEEDPPAIGANDYALVTPDVPTIDRIYLAIIDSSLQIVQASWASVSGAQSYVIQTSDDNVNWQERARTSRASIELPAYGVGTLYVRVAGINLGQGPWASSSIAINSLGGLTALVPWDGTEWKVGWRRPLNSEGGEVYVYDNSGSNPVLKRTAPFAFSDTRDYSYTLAMATTDGNVVRDMIVSVDALVLGDSGTEPSGYPATLALSNTIPLPPYGLSFVLESGGVEGEALYYLSWLVPQESDLITVKIWVSEVDGFDPAIVTPAWEFTAPSPGWAGIPTSVHLPVALDSFGEHPPLYWRVGLFDVWGNEVGRNISNAQAMGPYPPIP